MWLTLPSLDTARLRPQRFGIVPPLRPTKRFKSWSIDNSTQELILDR
jgi:hypothetical protein